MFPTTAMPLASTPSVAPQPTRTSHATGSRFSKSISWAIRATRNFSSRQPIRRSWTPLSIVPERETAFDVAPRDEARARELPLRSTLAGLGGLSGRLPGLLGGHLAEPCYVATMRGTTVSKSPIEIGVDGETEVPLDDYEVVRGGRRPAC